MKIQAIILTTIAALTAFPIAANAELKIGVINMEALLRDSDPAKKAAKKLEKEFEKRAQDLDRTRQQLQKMQEDMERNAVTMSDSDRRAKEKEFAELNRDFQRRQRELNEDANSRRNEELQLVYERAGKAIRAIAEREGFDLILQEAVYASPRVDVTDRVIKALSEAAPAAK